MTWQAATGLRVVARGRREHHPGPAGPPDGRTALRRPGRADLDNLSDGFLPLPTGSGAESARLRLALHDWGVTTVVVPSEAGLAAGPAGRSVPVAVGEFTVALGTGPAHRGGAWVWDVRRGPPRRGRCRPTTSPGARRRAAVTADPGTAAACVLARSVAAGRTAPGPARHSLQCTG